MLSLPGAAYLEMSGPDKKEKGAPFDPREPGGRSIGRALLVSVGVAVLLTADLLTKSLAAANIAPGESIAVLPPVFHLVNVRNMGAAFGLFANFGNAFFIGVTLLAIVFILWLLGRGEESPSGLTLILSGAFGNLYDRVTLGYVRDFLDFSLAGYHWPAFNLADSCLTVGLFWLVISAFRKRGATARRAGPDR